MSAIPIIRPVSDLRNHQADVLAEISDAPVVLAQRGRPAAVLVSLETWNALCERLEDAEDALAVIEARQNPGPAVSLEEYLAGRESVSTSA
jgi:prevent-host-death family protein